MGSIRFHAIFYALFSIAATYSFPYFIVNKTISEEWQYVRDYVENRGVPPTLASFSIRNASTFAIVCGTGRTDSPTRGHEGIQTATVIAGSEVGFRVEKRWTEFDDDPYIWYRGPAQIFLSKAVEGDDLNVYEGDGEWFKISYQGPKDETTWSTYGHTSVNVTIPPDTPPGKYLMRIEHLIPSADLGKTRWFVACAQIEIVGPGGGFPMGMVRFPGAYSDDSDPSLWFHDENGRLPKNLSIYIEPFPAVWKGGIGSG